MQSREIDVDLLHTLKREAKFLEIVQGFGTGHQQDLYIFRIEES